MKKNKKIKNEVVLSQSSKGLKSQKFCPRCGSINVFWASGLPQLWSVWECRECGYRGPLIVEDGKLGEKLRKEYALKMKRLRKGNTES